MVPRVDYDQIAPEYDRRFVQDTSTGIAAALLEFGDRLEPAAYLEVGCGTGHWLEVLAGLNSPGFGLDLSQGMLRQAARQNPAPLLAQGDACRLPFASGALDWVYCVNAIHHFDNPAGFIAEAYRLLRPGGCLTVIGSQPPESRDCWFVYRYFRGTYQTDRKRFPGQANLARWFTRTGFVDFDRHEIERIRAHHTGRAVFADPFLRKSSCSQLALLSKSEYAAGLARIESDLARAERRGEELLFRTDLTIYLWFGCKMER